MGLDEEAAVNSRRRWRVGGVPVLARAFKRSVPGSMTFSFGDIDFSLAGVGLGWVRGFGGDD